MFIDLRPYITVIVFIFISAASFSEELPVFHEDEVIITASRHLELRSETPFNVSVINSREIEASGANNLGELLKGELGVYSKAKGSLGSENSLSMRGSSYQQVLVLVDGVKVNSPLLGGADAGDISINSIKQVEIVRGPVSSLYGSDAVGGVVNMITNKGPREDHTAIDVKMLEAGANTIDLSISKDQLGTSIGHDASNGYRPNSRYSANYFLSSYDTDDGKASISIRNHSSNKGIPGSTVYPYADALQSDSNTDVILSTSGTIGEKALQLKAFYLQKIEKVNLDPSSSPDQRFNCFSGGFELQGNMNDVDVGIEYKNDACDSTYAGIHSVANGAVYLQDENMLSDDIKVNYGARMDSNPVFGTSINPRLGVLWKAADLVKYRAVYGESFRAPTLNDLYWYSVDPVWGTIMSGNTGLKPERAKSVEIGMDIVPMKGVGIAMNAYSNRIENLIQWVDISGSWSTWEAQNVGRAETSGFELELTLSVSEWTGLFLNYTYEEAVNSDTGRHLAYRPLNRLNSGIQHKDDAGNILFFGMRYTGERYDDEANTRKVPQYTVCDMKYEREYADRSYYVGADNLFNEIFEDTLNYPMPGRIYYFGIKCKV